jgi:hypothetical protein
VYGESASRSGPALVCPDDPVIRRLVILPVSNRHTPLADSSKNVVRARPESTLFAAITCSSERRTADSEYAEISIPITEAFSLKRCQCLSNSIGSLPRTAIVVKTPFPYNAAEETAIIFESPAPTISPLNETSSFIAMIIRKARENTNPEALAYNCPASV